MRVAQLRRHSDDLGFTPRDQVRWLSPTELWRTAVKVALSSVFADYTDRREAQAALPAPVLAVRPDADELWIDHVADLGDGFDATYTVASLLAADDLAVAAPDGDLRLPRGDLLVLGGDEVYPTPSVAGYEDRTKGPYRAALAPVADGDPEPVMLALPGNHDWYDGLGAFLRVFAQRRHVGAWRTVQTRSYFAVRLPGRWWLVGLDTQLGSYVDDPQVRYFREHLSARLEPGDGVILAAPTPTWVNTGEGDPRAFDSLHWFERELVQTHLDVDTGRTRPTGARVRLWVSGDRHHYARYAAADELEGGGASRQFVTCGLGGAYLLDTHRLPERLVLPPPASRLPDHAPERSYTLQARWPSADDSRRFVTGVVGPTRRGLPFRNPGFWRLAGAVHAALLLLLASLLGLELGRSPVAALRTASVDQVLALAWQAAVWAAVATALWSLVPLWRGRRPRPPSETVLAVGAQVLVGFGALAAAVAVPWPDAWPAWLVLGLAVLGAWVLAGLVASFVFAAYVLLSRSPAVQGLQAAAQSVEDAKGFLRMHIGPDGVLTVYPVVVERVCHDWELQDAPGRPPGTVRPVPAGGLPVPVLAEPPVRIVRDPSIGTPGGRAVTPG